MPDVINVNHLDQLKQFLNNKNVLEIVEREADQKIKTFQKVALINLTDDNSKRAVNKLMSSLDSSNANLINIRTVVSLSGLNLLLNGVNLGVTVVGFAIIANKLSELEQSIKKLENTVQQGFFQESMYKYRNVLGKYEAMLDSRKRDIPSSEKDLHDLVHDLHNVLLLFLDFLQKSKGDNNKQIIDLIYSLLNMFTISLMYFDELYYSSTHSDKASNEIDWHRSHKNWMKVYDEMTAPWFVECLQDHGFIHSSKVLTLYGVDIYVVTLLDQVETCRQKVIDNQALIEELGDIEVLNQVREEVSERAKKVITEKLDEASLSDELHEKVLESLQWI